MTDERYYGTADLRRILGCNVRYAEQIMHMFAWRGQMYRIGRKLFVKKSVFERWMESNRERGVLE